MRGVVEEMQWVCGQWPYGKGGSRNAEGGKREERKKKREYRKTTS
jgi:hypothetical protein